MKLFKTTKPADFFQPKDLAGLNVLFINMPLRQTAVPNVAPLGIGYLCARLRQWGLEPTVVDLNAYRIKDDEAARLGLKNGRHLNPEETENLFRRHFNKHGAPDLVCLSGLITTLRWQTIITKTIRGLCPGAMIVSGGGLATQFKTGLLSWIPALDGVASGEGEDIILKIAFDANLIKQKGMKFAELSGKLSPCLVGEHDGRLKFWYEGSPIKDLDSLPFPDWTPIMEDVDGNRILQQYLETPAWGDPRTNNSSATDRSWRISAKTISSRGCPFSCKFCYRETQGGRGYRCRSANNIHQEVELLVGQYDPDFIAFIDDNFIIDRRRVADLAGILPKFGIDWGTHARMDGLADLKKGGQMAELLAQAGCVYIGFGAESASPPVIEAMGKGGFILGAGLTRIGGHEFPLTMVEAIKAARRVGIHGNCTWIMGYPGETLNDLKTSVSFIAWQISSATDGLSPGSLEWETARKAVNQAMFVATAYPGTEMSRLPVVRERLNRAFGINFDHETGDPIPDEHLRQYVLALDDATKVLDGQDGRPVNYGAMPDETFLRARELINNGRTLEILDL